MKTLTKHFIPEMHLHISPISRDLLLIAVFGMMVATAGLTILVILLNSI